MYFILSNIATYIFKNDENLLVSITTLDIFYNFIVKKTLINKRMKKLFCVSSTPTFNIFQQKSVPILPNSKTTYNLQFIGKALNIIDQPLRPFNSRNYDEKNVQNEH